ncbi:MAG: GNAT family N-acetyltransferase [Acidobacteriota bacterium]|nr:GNAT family N-acetyltransferase [Acidobacteriota bacterium]
MPEPDATIPRLEVERSYPRSVTSGDRELELRQMKRGDLEPMVSFATSLPQEDLLFLMTDIRRPEVVEGWIDSIEAGSRFTVVAEESGRLAGYGSLFRNDILWTRHLAEIRIIVSPEHRGCGLGGVLANEILEVARDVGLKKIVARMPRDQVGARTVFRKLGFDLESMLADWVIDLEGKTHDLVIMAFEF